MSHNNIKFGTAEPNRQGEVSSSLDNLSDVSASSPAAGQTIRYANPGWELGNVTTALSLFGVGASQAYPQGGNEIAVGEDLQFYGEAYNGAGVAGTYSGWFDSITLPAGEYVITAVSGVSMSASSGEVDYRWYNQGSSSHVGTTGTVGDDNLSVGSPCIAYVDPSSSTTYSVRATAVSNVSALASQGNRAAERGFIEVRKL